MAKLKVDMHDLEMCVRKVVEGYASQYGESTEDLYNMTVSKFITLLENLPEGSVITISEKTDKKHGKNNSKQTVDNTK